MIKKESPFLLDKAKFKSRRGLNELDQILVPFVTEKFQQLDEIDKILFGVIRVRRCRSRGFNSL